MTTDHAVGGLTIESDATVALAEGATPGADTVTVKGTLRFENTSPLTVAWKIVGTERIVMAGSGTVKLTNAAGFTGQIVTEGTGTYTIRRLTGSRSQIVNGTLIELKPRGGLMLLVR